MDNIITEMKNILEWIDSRLEDAEQIIDLGERVTESTQVKQEKEK